MMRDLFKPRSLLAVVPVIAILVLAACGGSSGGGLYGGGGTKTATPAAGSGGGTAAAKVSIVNFAFSPSKVTVNAGATVTWTNNDSTPHDVTSTNGPDVTASTTSLFASGTMNQGDTFSYKFTKPGTYYYECTIHATMPAMHAVVVVK